MMISSSVGTPASSSCPLAAVAVAAVGVVVFDRAGRAAGCPGPWSRPAPFLAAGTGPAMLMPGSDLRTSAAPARQSKGAGVGQHGGMHMLESTEMCALGTSSSFLCLHKGPAAAFNIRQSDVALLHCE